MHELNFSNAELGLLLELLECDQKELFKEIRHTDTRKFKNDLQARLATVESLIERTRAAHQVAQAVAT
jgi:hypothetical protein